MFNKIFGSTALAALAAAASAQTAWFSEVFVNPPSTDDGFEAVEIMSSAPNFNMNGWYMIIIEGDGTPKGTVDVITPITSVTGANRLLLLRDAATDLIPAPESQTTIQVQDWNPDMENGSNTWVLGYGTLGVSVGTDLDANNDGVLDSGLGAGFTIVDCFSYRDADNPDTDADYADDLGFPANAFGSFMTFTPDNFYRVLNGSQTAPIGFVGGDLLGENPGPVTWDVDGGRIFGWATFNLNPHDVPSHLGGLNVGVSQGNTVSGVITLLSFTGDVSTQSVTIEIRPVGNPTPLETYTVALDGNGNYALSTTLAEGLYDVAAKGPRSLRSVVSGVNIGPEVNVNFDLINGDCDDDNEVTLVDYGILSATFGKADGDLGYDGRADLDGDLEVNLFDAAILSANFGLAGDE